MVSTDKWIGTASADWGASKANWSRGFPNSNSNVEISTTSVLTVTYTGSDNFTVNSLTVGNDVFDMSGGSLTIKTTASFADGFTQIGGVLEAGGRVTVDGIGTLTDGSAEGKTAFVFDGTVALGNYTLGGATVLSNKKTTDLTAGIALGNNTGLNATIDNEKRAIFDIGGDYGVGQGAATAHFVNAGTLEKTGGSNTSSIGVDFTDTGRIIVATAGTLEFGGPDNSFAGAISGAGQIYLGNGSKDAIDRGTTVIAAIFTISDGGTFVTLNENLDLARAFNLQNSATLDLAGSDLRLSLSGTNTFQNSAALDGTGTLVTARGSTSNVNDFFLGGVVVWRNSGTVGEVNFLELGDTTFNPATFINQKGGVYEFAADVGIASGHALNSSFINLAGAVLEKTGGGNTTGSVIGVDVTDAGTILVRTGIMEFTGFTNSFAGKISGAGQFAIGGGDSVIGEGTTITTATFGIYNNSTLVSLGESLNYAGTFNLENAALMNLDGFSLTLAGKDTFGSNVDIAGTGKLATAKGSTISINGFTLGGAVNWQNSGTVGEFNTLVIGDSSFDAATFTNEKGGVFDFAAAVGIEVGAVPTSRFINDAGAVVEKTSGGDSLISVGFTNNGTVKVATGTLEFQTLVGGGGSFTIEPGAILQFDAGVAKGSTVDFATKTGGSLVLVGGEGFDAAIKGFGGTGTDEIELRSISGTVTLQYRGNATEGVLTVTNGAQTADLTFLGKYTIGDFHASADPSGGTLIVDPSTHAALLAIAH